LVLNPIQADNKNDLPVLGRLFLSSAYVMVSQETETFTVWQANTQPEAQDLVPLNKQSQINSTSDPDDTPPGTTSTTTSFPSSKKPKVFSAGIIVGIVIGCLYGLAVIAAIACPFIRRRKRGQSALKQDKQKKHNEVRLPTHIHSEQYDPFIPPSEMPGEQQEAAELDSDGLTRG
jgi:hypothetical protein